MSSKIAPQQYAQALLDHVQNGTFPESEEVVSAELPPSALPAVSKLIEQAREDAKAAIRKNSRNSAPDVDGWITRAKQLRIDIQKSQEIAREIVEEARQYELLEERVKDTTSKSDLLNGELAFNKSLEATLERLQAVQKTLDVIQRATLDNQLTRAVDLLAQVRGDLAGVSVSRTTRVVGLLEAKITDLRDHVSAKLIECWNAYINIDSTKSAITIGQVPDSSPLSDITALANAMIKMQLFDNALQQFCADLETLIIQPRLQLQKDGTVASLGISDHEIRVSGRSPDLSAQSLFSDLDSVIIFLRSCLPPAVVQSLADLLMPSLTSKLISIWLASAVPEDLDSMEDFQDTLSLVHEFGQKIESYNWPGRRELVEWNSSIPNVWLRKRREISLNNVRRLLSKGLGATETVERVETEVVTRDDDVFAGGGGGDDWNAGWSDEDTSSPKKTTHPSRVDEGGGEVEEDVSAWGLDDDKEDIDLAKKEENASAAEDEAEAWGWGDENDGEDPQSVSQVRKQSPIHSKRNGMPEAPQQERQITLKETYNVTSLPREVLAIIMQVISDAETLETPDHANSPIAAAAPDLLSLPGLILALYRAIAPPSYSPNPSGPMFLYNDSLWLAERLQQIPSHQNMSKGRNIQSRTSYNLNLATHIQALETFRKRAYTKEMESQRLIITDLLDGSQGFRNCTEYPFNQDCDIAIASTIDRLRDLHKQWSGVLSLSVLLQALGSLLSTVAKKVINDIEDLADISEPESQQLTAYCNRIATLEDLFPQTAEQTSQTAVYTAHWLKFRYLANILESSLVDIKYLWTEGELGLFYDTEELVDLVVALFAEGPHRRNAIAEIRSRRGTRS